ncbi:MAG: uroporphyrinogen decarboxylase [Candidatus Micrarchaeales archaeon]|jgi:uroporphyrinogen decarboxylase|uniref:Uroporphyrinogen decarboxylase n=1 Tax=Candidatus Micrarchaeum acidiphilum ARMAN-2 TaxID=425595 RepID=C7DH18_MICA2|nr:MAG: uroporphyrinogen decarboxylase [Candidatus Micrarchaeum acidiphilum ARMAN-2]MCW6161424.1 uroporphyrinogen decarboxylase [Candidatus Micrarchaeales archaeon]
MDNIKDSLFIRACYGKHVERHPVWFMRQAGRYLPEYSKIKGARNVLDVQSDPLASSEITVLPVDKLGVDAAILYADIMIPIRAAGLGVRIEENIGPVMDFAVGEPDDLAPLERFSCDRDAPYVLENIVRTKEKLAGRVPLIGFAAGPFTLLSYLLEGRPSRTFDRCRAIIQDDPDLWSRFMDMAASMTIRYLRSQVRTGVDAVQIFDSWAGFLEPEVYRKHVLEHTKRIVDEIKGIVPIIHFSARSSGIMRDLRELDCEVISIGPDVELKLARSALGNGKSLQGNLDPSMAVRGGAEMLARTDSILDEMDGVDGFVFNLGHGVAKDTPPENLMKIVERVKARPAHQ